MVAGDEPAAELDGAGYQQERQRLDQRYQRVHRAIALASVSSEADVEALVGAEGSSSVPGLVAVVAPPPPLISAERQREMLINGPVVRFLTRPGESYPNYTL